MVRTKESTSRSKGKGVASSQNEPAQQYKRRRNPSVIDESETEEEMDRAQMEESEEEEMEIEQGGSRNFVLDVDGLPKWGKTMRLSSFPSDVQPTMYMKKISQSKQSQHKLFLCERAVNIDDFGAFGILECFDRLGWKENLTFHNVDNDEIYMNEIFEWMSRLKKREGKTPATTELIGYVGDKEVVLSFKTMAKLAKFDNAGPYEYPDDATLTVKKANEESWKTMIRELFVVPPETDISSWPLWRKNMHVLPRLLLTFVTTNVMPRTSDMEKVRLFEVLIIYALMTGSPMLSARHLIMWNVWESRERQERKIIPHARLLSKLLLKSKAIKKGVRGTKYPHIPYRMATFCKASDWVFTTTRTKQRLTLESTGRFLEVRRRDIESDEESEEETHPRNERPGVREPRLTGFAPEMFGSPYYSAVYGGVQQARPQNFENWTDGTQAIFDRQSQEIEENRIFRRSVMYQLENQRNDDFRYNEQIRHDRDYERGLPYTTRPRPTDWQNPLMEPYEVTHQMPHYPQSTPSPWISPYQQQDQGPGSSSSTSPFDTSTLQQSLYESVFGRQYQPPPYDG